MSGLKTYLCVLDCVFSGSIYFYFYCLRHVYCQDMSYVGLLYDAKTPFLQLCIFVTLRLLQIVDINLFLFSTDMQYYREQARLSKFYRFDVSNYRSDAGSEELTEAEIKLRQVSNYRKQAEQRFSLYQLLPSQNAPRRKHLYSKSVNTASQGWITFDVTETVREWITVPGMVFIYVCFKTG